MRAAMRMQENGPARRLEVLVRQALFVLSRRRINRDTSNVSAEYTAGWSQYRKHLAAARSLHQWLRIPGLEDRADWRNVDGQLQYGLFDSGAYYRAALLAALRRHFPDARSITEFGCGVGRNLLFLKEQLGDCEVAGYELCSPGVEVAKAAAEKFNFDVRYAQLDYVVDPPSKYVLPVTDVAFTMFSLEQLPRQVAQALHNILDRARLGTIHIEPVPENYPFSPRGLLGRLDHWKVGYLSGFEAAVHQLGLKEVYVERLASAHNPLMFPSLYVLRK